eukprot:1099782-Prymnesium_polylepis.1
MRFLLRALEERMISAEEYDELLPRMRDSFEPVARPDGAESPEDASAGERQALARRLAHCVIDVVRRQQEAATMPRTLPSRPPGSKSRLECPQGTGSATLRAPQNACGAQSPGTQTATTKMATTASSGARPSAEGAAGIGSATGSGTGRRKFAFPAGGSDSLTKMDPLK